MSNTLHRTCMANCTSVWTLPLLWQQRLHLQLLLIRLEIRVRLLFLLLTVWLHSREQQHLLHDKNTCVNHGAVQTSSAEVSKVSKIVKLLLDRQWLQHRQQKQRKSLRWVLKIDVVCLYLFCKLAEMMKCLVFDSEKNENNAHWSYYIASHWVNWLVNFLSADMFVFVYINHRRNVYFKNYSASAVLHPVTSLPPAKKLLAVWTCHMTFTATSKLLVKCILP